MTFKTIITTDRDKARAALNILTGENCDQMLPSGLAETSAGPATHWIGAGDVPEVIGFNLEIAMATMDLYSCSDVSDEQNFVAMARLGLVLVEVPMEVFYTPAADAA